MMFYELIENFMFPKTDYKSRFQYAYAKTLASKDH